MSAETIPAEVIELVAKTIHDHWQGAPGLSARPWDGEKGTCTKLPAQAEDFRRKARAVMEALATRPAEPAAPVAEAGEVVAWGVEMYGFWELCNDEETARYRHEPARKVEPLVRLSTLEAERARADAAEQRAAAALARAEKAEGALAEARVLAERGAHLARTVSQTRFRLEDGGRYSLGMFDANNMVALAYSAARASREAQPATDGGDNG